MNNKTPFVIRIAMSELIKVCENFHDCSSGIIELNEK